MCIKKGLAYFHILFYLRFIKTFLESGLYSVLKREVLKWWTILCHLMGAGGGESVVSERLAFIGCRPHDLLIVLYIAAGCDSGFGKAAAQHLDALGFEVFATVLDLTGDGARELQRTCSAQLTLLQVDITQPQQVQQALLDTKAKLGLKGTNRPAFLRLD